MSRAWQRQLALEKHRRALIWWQIMLQREREIEAKAREIEWLKELAAMLPRRRPPGLTTAISLLLLCALLPGCRAPDYPVRNHYPPQPAYTP